MAYPGGSKLKLQVRDLSEKGTAHLNQYFNMNLRPTFVMRIACACASIFLVLSVLSYSNPAPGTEVQKSLSIPENYTFTTVKSEAPESYDYSARGAFNSLRVKGFDNSGIPGGEYVNQNLSCMSLVHTGEIGVQSSFYLHDNFIEIAEDLDSHPMIDYAPALEKLNAEPSFSLSKLLSSSWDSIATSCVWMPDYKVYLCVSRIRFHPEGPAGRQVMSFLRGHIYSEDWTHQDRYRLQWKDQEIVFPKVFDVDAEFKVGGELYGPEDPRITLEEGVDGAEPVIIYNMITSRSGWKRAMWIFRPFSGRAQIMTLRNKPRFKTEKNWAPFFPKSIDNPTPTQPSLHLHFVWFFEPLTVIRCHLVSGMCDIVFEQEVAEDLLSEHEDFDSSLRGGTQFVPIPRIHNSAQETDETSNMQAFVSFPRTHVEHVGNCREVDAAYRPEMVVLLTNTTHYYLTYGSEALDFGPSSVMEQYELSDPCGEGRIMIANSLSRWDFNAKRSNGGPPTDVMTLTVSVADATVQILRLSGVWDFIRAMPSMAGFFGTKDPLGERDMVTFFPSMLDPEEHEFGNPADEIDPFERATAVGWDVRACVEESAIRYIETHGEKLSAEKQKKMEEDRQKRKKKVLQAQEERRLKKEKADEERRKKADEEATRIRPPKAEWGDGLETAQNDKQDGEQANGDGDGDGDYAGFIDEKGLKEAQEEADGADEDEEDDKADYTAPHHKLLDKFLDEEESEMT